MVSPSSSTGMRDWDKSGSVGCQGVSECKFTPSLYLVCALWEKGVRDTETGEGLLICPLGHPLLQDIIHLHKNKENVM